MNMVRMDWRKMVIATAFTSVIGAVLLFSGFYAFLEVREAFIYTSDEGNGGMDDLSPDPDQTGGDQHPNGTDDEKEPPSTEDTNETFGNDREPDTGNITPPGDDGTGKADGSETSYQNYNDNKSTLNGDPNERSDENTRSLRYFGGALSGLVLLILFSLLIFSYTRMRSEELLKQERRLLIYKYIIDHPGDHFRAVQRAVGLQVGVLSHHINILEKEQLIVSEQDGNNRRFYAAGVKRTNGEVRLSRVQENILRSIQATPGITQSQIAKDLGVNRKVVFYNVKFLSGSGIVTEQKVRRRAHYYPNDI